MVQVAAARKIVPKSRFRVEIDGIGDLRVTVVGALKLSMNIIETDEGGAATTTEMTTNGYSFDPIQVSRPLTEDMALADWADALKKGKQDKKNGVLYAMDASGADLYKWTLEECIIADYQEFEGDGKAKEESAMEIATLRYRERGKRQKLQ